MATNGFAIVLASVLLAATTAQPRAGGQAPVQAPAHGSSPAALLALDRDTPHPLAMGTLGPALTDSRAEVRSTAARMAWRLDVAELAPGIVAALRNEVVPHAAREQIRALAALGTSEADAAIVDALKRFSQTDRPFALDASMVYAQGRGVSAVDHLATFRAAGADRIDQLGFVFAATRRETGALGALAERAIQDGRWDDLSIVFDAAVVAPGAVPDEVIGQALRAPSTQPQVAALWHLLSRGAVPDSLRAPIAAIAQPSPSDDGTAIAFEFIRRLMGGTARTDKAWLTLLARVHPQLTRPVEPGRASAGVEGAKLWFFRGGVASHLTKAERNALRKAYPRARGFPFDLADEQWFRLLPDEQWFRLAVVPVARTPSNHPAGVLADVLAASGCKVPRKSGTVVSADVTLSEEGRVALVGTLNGDTSTACLDAARMLFAAYAPEPSAHGYPEREITLVVPLSERFVGCSAKNDGLTATPVTAATTTIDEYLPGVWGIGGPVTAEAIVSTTGCVVDLRLFLTCCVHTTTSITSNPPRELTRMIASDVVDRRFWLPKQSGAESRVQFQLRYHIASKPTNTHPTPNTGGLLLQ